MRLARAIIFFIAILLIWESIYRLKIYPEVLFPSPIQVGEYLLKGLLGKTLILAGYITLKRLLIGYIISIFVGIPIGLALSRFQLLKDTVGSIALGLQALPSICWAPLAILWIGQNEQAMFFIVIMGALFSIIISTDAGVRNVSPIFVRAAKTMGSKGVHTYTKVIIPAALPSIVTGMKMGWSFAWRSLMAGEMIIFVIGAAGVGQHLSMGRELNDMPRVIGLMFIIVIIGLVADKLVFSPWEHLLHERWGTKKI